MYVCVRTLISLSAGPRGDHNSAKKGSDYSIKRPDRSTFLDKERKVGSSDLTLSYTCCGRLCNAFM